MRAIDSLTLRLPVDELLQVDASLFSGVSVVCDDTAEIIDRKNTAHIRHENNGITTKFYRKVVFDREYLYVTINSKQLETRYLQGITIDNVRHIYNYVLDCGRFICSFDTFLDGGVHDVDIKTDFQMEITEWEENLNYRHKFFPMSKLYRHQNVVGLEYNTRHNATNTKPFVKFYSKCDELKTNSEQFYKEYLINQHFSDLRRCEVTIKNANHWKYLQKREVINEVPTTFRDILSFSQTRLHNIILFCVNIYESNIVNVERLRKAKKGLTASDIIIKNLLGEWCKTHSLDSLVGFLSEGYKDKSLEVMSSRWRKKLDKLLEAYRIDNDPKLRRQKLFRDIKEVF